MNEVFAPVIREKSIILVSEMPFSTRKVAVDLLESHSHKFLEEMSSELKPVASPQITEAITFFLKNEKQLVL